MCRTKFSLFTLLIALPLALVFLGCSDKDKGSAPTSQQSTAVTCPFISTFDHDCDNIAADDSKYLCVEGLRLGNPATAQGELSIANPNGRTTYSYSPIFALDWAQFKTSQQSFKDCNISCLNPIAPGRPFDEAVSTLGYSSPNDLLEAISQELSNIAVGIRTVTITTGKCN